MRGPVGQQKRETRHTTKKTNLGGDYFGSGREYREREGTSKEVGVHWLTRSSPLLGKKKGGIGKEVLTA